MCSKKLFYLTLQPVVDLYFIECSLANSKKLSHLLCQKAKNCGSALKGLYVCICVCMCSSTGRLSALTHRKAWNSRAQHLPRTIGSIRPLRSLVSVMLKVKNICRGNICTGKLCCLCFFSGSLIVLGSLYIDWQKTVINLVLVPLHALCSIFTQFKVSEEKLQSDCQFSSALSCLLWRRAKDLAFSLIKVNVILKFVTDWAKWHPVALTLQQYSFLISKS